MNKHDEDLPTNAGQEKEWVKEVHGIYAGLIAIAIVMIQPFMYQGEFSGTAAMVCVYSFAISVPILAALLLLNYFEEYRRHLSQSKAVAIARALAQIAAVVGVIAGFWHISPIAGMLATGGGVFGGVAYTIGYMLLSKRRSTR